MFEDLSRGKIESQPNNLCTVGWLSWLVSLNFDQKRDLEDYLAVVGFHEGIGFRFEWTSATFDERLALKNPNHSGVYYLNFPESFRKYVVPYFMGATYYKHRS